MLKPGAAASFIIKKCGTPSPPPAPTGPAKCTPVQQLLIKDCTSDCLGCNTADVTRTLKGCVLEAHSKPQQAGVTFCVKSGTPCTSTQHASLIKCLASCPDCNIAATKASMGICRVDMDRVWGGVSAADLVQDECTIGRPCSNLQNMIAARCVKNCDGCDFTATGTVLGMCAASDHPGSAIVFVKKTCKRHDENKESGDGNPIDEVTHKNEPPLCSMLQAAIYAQCTKDCNKCKVPAVRTVIADCVLENGKAAIDLMCTEVKIDLKTGCSALQLAVIQHCTKDCMSCNAHSTDVVLSKCKIGQDVQAVGRTFCIRGKPCTPTQHTALAKCISNCKRCNKDATLKILGDCAADTDKIFGGVRAQSLITTECALGVRCTKLQRMAASMCLRDCSKCKRDKTGTVLGSCTEEGHGMALSMIEDTCDKATSPPPPPGDGGPPPPPPPPAKCTKLELAVMDLCRDNCAKCDVKQSKNHIGDCVLSNGVKAADNLCSEIHVDKETQGMCTPLQNHIIGLCTSNCAKCKMATINTILAKCKNGDGVVQEAGTSFCRHR